jgi:hypothetical protein
MPDEPHELGDHPVVRATDRQVAVFVPRGGVDHHRDVDIVEGAESHHLGLATQKLQRASRSHRQPLLDLDVLLGRYRHQDHATGYIADHLA